MFIPLGLGHWPKRLPIALLLLICMTVTFSFQKFPDLKEMEENIERSVSSQQIANLTSIIIYKSCLSELESSSCDVFLKEYKEKHKAPKGRETEKLNLLQNFSDLSDIAEHLSVFSTKPQFWPESAKMLDEYQEMSDLLTQREVLQGKEAKSHGFLTRENISFTSILSAGFYHADIFHLIGNLFFLLVFGLYLEMAFGSILTFCVFLLGSYFGIFVEVITMTEVKTLLGASAGVSAIIGAFLFTFFKAKMRFVFTFLLVYFRSLYLPVAIAVPLMFLINDLIGAASRATAGSPVAHLAHLGGLFIGLLAAFLFQKSSLIRFPFLFEDEKDLYLQAKSSSSTSQRIALLLEARGWNPQNPETCKMALEAVAENAFLLDPKESQAITLWTRRILNEFMTKKKWSQAAELIELSMGKFKAHELLNGINWVKVINLADRCLDTGQLEVALFLYKYQLSTNTPKLDRDGLRKTCENIEQELNLKKEIENVYSPELASAS